MSLIFSGCTGMLAPLWSYPASHSKPVLLFPKNCFYLYHPLPSAPLNVAFNIYPLPNNRRPIFTKMNYPPLGFWGCGATGSSIPMLTNYSNLERVLSSPDEYAFQLYPSLETYNFPTSVYVYIFNHFIILIAWY